METGVQELSIILENGFGADIDKTYLQQFSIEHCTTQLKELMLR